MSEWSEFFLRSITIIFLVIVFISLEREWIISKEEKAFYINGALATGSLLSLVYVIGGM